MSTAPLAGQVIDDVAYIRLLQQIGFEGLQQQVNNGLIPGFTREAMERYYKDFHEHYYGADYQIPELTDELYQQYSEGFSNRYNPDAVEQFYANQQTQSQQFNQPYADGGALNNPPPAPPPSTNQDPDGDEPPVFSGTDGGTDSAGGDGSPYTDEDGYLIQTNPDGTILVSGPNGIGIGQFANYEAFQSYMDGIAEEEAAALEDFQNNQMPSIRDLLQTAYDAASAPNTSGMLPEGYDGYQTYQAGASNLGTDMQGPWLSSEMSGIQGTEAMSPDYGMPVMASQMDFSQFSNPTAYAAPVQQSQNRPMFNQFISDEQRQEYEDYLARGGLL